LASVTESRNKLHEEWKKAVQETTDIQDKLKEQEMQWKKEKSLLDERIKEASKIEETVSTVYFSLLFKF